MKILIAFYTYPRDGKSTFDLLNNAFNSLLNCAKLDFQLNELKFIVIGDDYNNLDELRPIFKNVNVDFYNINVNDALRNKHVAPSIKWKYAVNRSIIFSFEKAIETDYDYVFTSADDDVYINDTLNQYVMYIEKYNKPDLAFSYGYHFNKMILPCDVNINLLLGNPNLLQNYHPKPANCIPSGMMYNIKNIKFMQDIINFRRRRQEFIQNNINNGIASFPIEPEDAELWIYLSHHFANKTYRSLLIPHILVDHVTQGTAYCFYDNSSI